MFRRVTTSRTDSSTQASSLNTAAISRIDIYTNERQCMILRSAFLDLSPNHSTTLVLCCTAAECFSSPALPQRDFAAGAHFAQLDR